MRDERRRRREGRLTRVMIWRKRHKAKNIAKNMLALALAFGVLRRMRCATSYAGAEMVGVSRVCLRSEDGE